jgi:hypothetical protein
MTNQMLPNPFPDLIGPIGSAILPPLQPSISTSTTTSATSAATISLAVKPLADLLEDEKLPSFEEFVSTSNETPKTLFTRQSTTQSTTLSTTQSTTQSTSQSTSQSTTLSSILSTTLATNVTSPAAVDTPATHWFLCFLLTFVLGGLTAVIVKTITAPLEKVKMVQQTFLPQNPCDVNLSEKNVFALFGWVYRNMGCLAFWDGNIANCIRYVPKFALDMSVKVGVYTIFRT